MEAHAHDHAHPMEAVAAAAVAALPAAEAPAAAAAAHAMHHGAEFLWRPTVDSSDCRFHGLLAHALLLGALAVAVVPYAVAARAHHRTLIAAAVLQFVGACFSNAVQRTCLAHGGHTSLRSGNMHAALGWLVACVVLVASAAHALLSSSSAAHPRIAARRAVQAAERASLRVCASLFGLRVRLAGWCFTAAYVSGLLLLLSGVWSTLDCYDSPGFVGYEIGAPLQPCGMLMRARASDACLCGPHGRRQKGT
jgi:hypothetical protein